MVTLKVVCCLFEDRLDIRIPNMEMIINGVVESASLSGTYPVLCAYS